MSTSAVAWIPYIALKCGDEKTVYNNYSSHLNIGHRVAADQTGCSLVVAASRSSAVTSCQDDWLQCGGGDPHCQELAPQSPPAAAPAAMSTPATSVLLISAAFLLNTCTVSAYQQYPASGH